MPDFQRLGADDLTQPDLFQLFRGKERISLFTYANGGQCAVLTEPDGEGPGRTLTLSWTDLSGKVHRHTNTGDLIEYVPPDRDDRPTIADVYEV